MACNKCDVFVSKIFGGSLRRFLITRNTAMIIFILESGVNEKLKDNELAAYLSPFQTKSQGFLHGCFQSKLFKVDYI